MKIHRILTIFLVCVVLLGQTASAQDKKYPEDPRVARLVGLARVWGTVKYFHPYLAYREIDWDKALVETIPKVNAAKNAQEYEAAINQMFAVLNDKSTRAQIEPATKLASTKPSPGAKHVSIENKVLVIDAAELAKAIANDSSALAGSVKSINEALPNASGIVIDTRSTTRMIELDTYYFDLFMRQTLPAILDGDVVLGTSRYRLHSGYATQTAGGYSDYYSALANSSPKMLQGRAKSKTPPIVFIVNQNSPTSIELLSGLQSANRAFVIQEGALAPEAGGAVFTMDLPDNVKARIRTSEAIYADGSTEFQPDRVVTVDAMKEAMQALQENKPGPRPSRPAPPFAAQRVQKDEPYADMKFPTVEYRLLALFRFWNVISYFFPYKHLIGDSWESVLPRYIAKFEANKDQTDYQLTVREMVTEIHDAHGGARNTSAAGEKFGTFMPPAFVGYVEEKSVVTKVLDEKLPIKVGDVVLTIDGEPVEKKREYLARYIASSTPQWLERLVHFRLLFGPKDSVTKLRVRGSDNQVREVSLPRSESIMDPKFAAALQRTTPVMQILPSGFGYVDLSRLQAGEVDKMFDTIKNTSAVIFDMRGYPNGTAWSIAPRLSEKKNVIAALFSRPFVSGPSLSDPEVADTGSHAFSQRIPERKGDAYKGKVVMLINEDAISQAEHTCLFFETSTDVTFIGTPTAGANGDITFMVLPGNVQVSFSGHDVRHADGRQLQRVGIQPTIRVAPTVRGLIEGRDEVLERAVKYLGESSKK